MRSFALFLALSTIGLGAVGLAFGDFALQWQPVPAWIPARSGLAIASALVLIALGCITLIPRWSRAGGLGLAINFALWAIALQLPGAVAAPLSVAAWLGVAECASLAAGGLMIFASGHRRGEAMVVTARTVFGSAALVFGLSHFVYADFTAAMVPGFMPAPLFWAYATGIGHTLAGLAILVNRLRRVAATAMAGMCGGFVVLLHAPRVMATPSSHIEWTMLCIAICISGAAWTMREPVPSAPA